jgi:hypothetical protein
MKCRNLIPAIVALAIASGSAFAHPGASHSMASPSMRPAGIAARFTILDRIDPAIVGQGPCTTLQAAFDRELSRPATRRLHNMAAATALRREGAGLCRRGDVLAGTDYLEAAIATLLARPAL